MTAKLRIIKHSLAVAATASKIAFKNHHESNFQDFHSTFRIRRAPPSVSSVSAEAMAAKILSARNHHPMNLVRVHINFQGLHLSALSEGTVASTITKKNINAPAGAFVRDSMTKVFQHIVENKFTVKNYYESTRRDHPFGMSGPRFFTR